MTKKELITEIGEYIDRCENADTWEDIGLVEKALSLLEASVKFLNEE